jgi:cephalosporin hydroxylase/2-polyprenyl-3-methyl-5-hydroxy-6-metoxy-1,4-benzoquinol methylase
VTGLPPSVVDAFERDDLRSYWLARARQHTEDSYAGLGMSKFPEDLRAYEHLLWLSAPDTIIEIGTQYGASALWFRDRLRTLQAYGRLERRPRVITIDADQSLARAGLPGVDAHYAEDIELVEADVTDPALPDRIAAMVGPQARCLVIEDSAHDARTTSAALKGFARFVPPGGFMVVEDGCVDVDAMRLSPDWPRGVLPALHEWLATPEGQDFEVRRDLELYGISCHPHGFLQRRGGKRVPERPRLPAGIVRELVDGTNWMYDWDFGLPERLTLLNPELGSVHATRLELLEAPVRAALEEAGSEATVLDLACSEGWFGHKLLEWGAKRVVGIDLRHENVRRAIAIRDHVGIPPDRLELRQADVYALDLERLGTFDIVLCLGLVYHVEDPVGVLRRARALTRRLCVVESQLTRQTDPIVHGWGTTDSRETAPASFALHIEDDALLNPVASASGIASLVPNRAALEATVRAAGFTATRWCEPREHHNAQYRAGDRGQLVAYP